jgi:hypothetical protein
MRNNPNSFKIFDNLFDVNMYFKNKKKGLSPSTQKQFHHLFSKGWIVRINLQTCEYAWIPKKEEK